MSTTDSSVTSAFSGLAAKAEAMLGQAESNAQAPTSVAPTPAEPSPLAETPATPVVAAAPTTGAPEAQTPASPATDPTPLDVSPDTLIKVKINGQEQIVKAGEFKDMIQQTAVFTQRQQAVAQQQRQLEEYFAQREAQLLAQQQYVQQVAQQLQAQQDPVQVLRQALATTNQPAPPGPNEIATHGEIQQVIAALQQQFAQQVQQVEQKATTTAEQKVEQARQEMWIAQEQAKATAGFQSILSSDDGKLLAEVNPLVEPALRFTVAKMGPRSTEEALEFAAKVAKDWANTVRGKMVQQQKVEAVVKAKTVMEPPAAGTAPTLVQSQAKPQSFLKKDGSIDVVAMRERAMAIMDSVS